jgi:hypothetical protein
MTTILMLETRKEKARRVERPPGASRNAVGCVSIVGVGWYS